MELNLPPYQPPMQRKGEKLLIQCLVRKKWLVLTPEEWVRQHFLNYLFSKKGCSRSLTAVEYGLEYNGLKKRIDILVFDSTGQPSLMIECKAPHIPLNKEVLFQLSTYNAAFQVAKLCITNGMQHHWFEWSGNQYLPSEH